MTEKPSIQLHDVGVSYHGKEALRTINAEIPAGQLTAVVGPNGSGKSTLLQAVAGLNAHTGSIRVGGKPLRDYPRRDRVGQLSYVEQAGPAGMDVRVREVVELGRLAGRGLFVQPEDEDLRLINRAMVDADVGELAERRLPTLSGGEQQRTHVARALAQDAGVMVLDEPTNHLDLAHQHRLMELLQHLAHEDHHGGAVLLALHDLSLAARYCDRVVVLHDGALAAFGAPREVLTAQLLAEVFGIDGELVVSPRGVLMLECVGPIRG